MLEYCPYCLETLGATGPDRCTGCGRPRPALSNWPRDPLLGKVIGQQRVLRRTASPGVAVHYICEDTRDGAERWIGCLPESLCACSDATSDRSTTLTQLRHDNLATYRGLGLVKGFGFITVVEPIPGAPLRDVLARLGRFDGQQAMWLGLQIVQGLAAAHDVGVHHGAITPESVWITDSGDVKLAGFEFSEAVGGPHRGCYTARLLEMPQLLAPEQLARGLDITRADIYQVAAVVYMAWTGQPHLPPLGPDLKRGLEALISYHNRIADRLGPRPSDRIPELRKYAPRLDSLIGSMLSSDPTRRPIAMEIVKAMWWQCAASPEPSIAAAEPAPVPLVELPPPV